MWPPFLTQPAGFIFSGYRISFLIPVEFIEPLIRGNFKMGLLTFIQIPCHRVLANEIALNFKYRIGLKHLFNINLGIGIIKKTTFFVCIFDISPRVFTQISIRRACWMRN